MVEVNGAYKHGRCEKNGYLPLKTIYTGCLYTS